MLPCLYHDAEELRIILCAIDERTLTRQGIEWENCIITVQIRGGCVL